MIIKKYKRKISEMNSAPKPGELDCLSESLERQVSRRHEPERVQGYTIETRLGRLNSKENSDKGDE
jgi:hypothetical protein